VRLAQPGGVLGGALAADGSLVATISREPGGEQRARVFDARSGRLLHVLPQLGIRAVAFNNDGSLLATGSADGTTGLWLPGSGEEVHVLFDGGKSVLAVAFNPTGTLVATGAADGATRVWSAAKGDRRYIFTGHT